MMDINRAGIWMRVAKTIATMSTCPRRAVGAVILNDLGHVLATGFNGVPSGMTSCFTNDCGASREPTKDNLDKCLAIHAEQNALMQCNSVRDTKTLICTASPCMHCTKMLLNTPIDFIIYGELYDQDAMVLWMDSKRNHAHVEV